MRLTNGAEITVTDWTAVEVRALRRARRMSVREFAAHLGVSDRAVSHWERLSSPVHPRAVNQAALDTSLEQADAVLRRRFAGYLAELGNGSEEGNAP